MKLTKDRSPYERVRLRGRRIEMEWEGDGGGAAAVGNQGREIREKGEGLPLPFPSHAFSRTAPPPPLSPFPFFSCHATTKLCFSTKTIASKGVGDQGSRGERGKWLPIPCRFRVFLPLPLSFFSPVTQLWKSVSVKLLLRKGWEIKEGSRGERGKWLPIPFRFRVFLPPPLLFFHLSRGLQRELVWKLKSTL